MEVTTSIWSVVTSLHRVALLQRRAAAATPLGPVGLGLLNLAAVQPSLRPKDAADELDVAAQSVTRAIADLEARGYVRRAGDRADGRSYVIELTTAGKRARQEFRRQLIRQFSRHLADWEPAEIVRFARQLDRLVTSLSAGLPERPVTAAGRRNPWRS
ncbi:MarR family winged helix-turn-helix transcriptional regulator [Actinoplanes sp. NPDC051411]|uniref:MarR family winged helix-turn-helix transcriptional regulator n=1 Tax=Actinoplanes sp. NPDC051411 TaxID=3155522 RepID=UPI0034144516